MEDKLNGRLYQNQFDYVSENLFNEVGDNLTTKVGKPIIVYKFRKTSGTIKLTNLGERSLDYDNNIFRQSTNVYTGKEPITVVWDNSTTLSLDANDNIIKECKVGTYYNLYFETSTDANLTIDNISILDKNYVNTYITKTINLKSYDWEVNENDMLEYLYLILDKRNQSLQWLEINTYQNYYQEETRKFIESNITFENINLKYSQSGKTLIDFIQLGSIGEGYAFPVEEYDDNGEAIITLDENLILRQNDGVSQLQYDFNNGVANSDFLFWGRPKETLITNDNGIYKINVHKTQMLFPYKANFPKSGNFFYNKPNLNSFMVLDAYATKQEIWSSYKEAYKGNSRIGEYNVDKTKQVLTGFKCDVNTVRNTNPNWSTYINWDNERNNIMNMTFKSLEPIPYINKEIISISRQATYCEFFIINAFLNWYTDVIKFDYRETIKWKLTDVIGILGSTINTLVGGLDIGWTTKSLLAPTQPLNFLIPCVSFEDGKSALSDDAPLPSDIFIDNNIKKVLPTSTNVLTSWNFSLTDQFIDNTITDNLIPEIGKGLNGIWNTKYLEQTHDENGNQLLSDGRPLLLNLNSFQVFQPSTLNGFIIDVDKHHTIGECDYRLSSYNANDETIYSLYSETNAKARNEITVWENLNKYNYYDKFNTVGQATWPSEVKPPKPSLNLLEVEIYNGLINLIPNNILGDFYTTWPSTWTNPRPWSKTITRDQQTIVGGIITKWAYTCKRDGVENTPSTHPDINYEKQQEIIIQSTINTSNYTSIKLVFSNGNETIIDIGDNFTTLVDNSNKETFTFKETYSAMVSTTNNKLQAFPGQLISLEYELSSLKVRAQIINNNIVLTFQTTISNIIVNQFNGGLDTTYISSGSIQQQLSQGDLTNVFDKINVNDVFLIP